MKSVSRRGIVKGIAALAALPMYSHSTIAAVFTPSATEGPFYPETSMRFPDIDNDLVKVAGAVEQAGGEIIHLKGKILSKAGLPLTGHKIEIWQCDVNGKYLHTGDDRNVTYDSGFQGFGHDVTDEEGNYRFRTIKPTVYPGRTPHIHVKVFDGDRELLTTQFYIAGDSRNQADSIFRRMSKSEADSVSMEFVENNNRVETRVDVVV
ncbi:protocatechuate 3,4-dioxygenase [Vibrio sp. SCSIO 43132]|uniref:dioxygenase family protein n=1 Tax=Vibrio sp. SCSIO 43132 TaxID=2779363 RepID=UPI001CA924B9|nr:protocatechuate 3,4-dioxygenase [Vibrio sp. SCSIO 43132]UAB73489.1 protocatechuate 3,4-dioxygenase [Vibrio sp. SCSIO 43132]